jgi:DDE family transposase
VKLWKVELAKLAEETGLEITVAHYPPGTSKWNRIEHRMLYFDSGARPVVQRRMSRDDERELRKRG